MQNNKGKSLIKDNFMTIIVAILFALMIAVGVTFAWLTDSFNDEGDAVIGEVGIEIYNNGTKVSGVKGDDGTYTIGTSIVLNTGANLNEAVPTNITIKNTGNIPGIVRCLIVVTNDEVMFDHEENTLAGAYNIIANNQLRVNQTDWVTLYDNELINDQNYFNSFYNKQIEGGASQKVIDSITPLVEGTNSATVYVFIRAEIVAYSGNAYQVDTPENPTLDKDKPFGVLTTDFLNTWTAWQ